MWEKNPDTVLDKLLKALEDLKAKTEKDIEGLKILGGLNVEKKETKHSS